MTSRITGCKIYIQDKSRAFRNLGVVVLGFLLVTQTLFLLDFLPRLIGTPIKYPTNAQCQLNNYQIINNWCLQAADHNGDIDGYYQLCYIAGMDLDFITTETVVLNARQDNTTSDLLIGIERGVCRFLYPEPFLDRLDLVARLQEASLDATNRTFDCWVNLVSKECQIIDREHTQSVFVIIQSILTVLWIICLLVTYSFYKIHQHRMVNGIWLEIDTVNKD